MHPGDDRKATRRGLALGTDPSVTGRRRDEAVEAHVATRAVLTNHRPQGPSGATLGTRPIDVTIRRWPERIDIDLSQVPARRHPKEAPGIREARDGLDAGSGAVRPRDGQDGTRLRLAIRSRLPHMVVRGRDRGIVILSDTPPAP